MRHVVDHTHATRALAAIAILLVAGMAVAQDAAAPPADLPSFLEHMGKAQEGLRTLSAEFTQEKTLELLAEPDVASGQLSYEAPSRILWEYRMPDPTTLLIDEKTLLAYYPDLKKADRVDIAEKRERYDRYFGMALGGQGLMQEHFDVSLAKESGMPGAALLVLTPKSKRIEKYLTEIRLWVDVQSYLPRRFEYREENGDTTTYTLTSVVANRPFPPGRFEVALPADVQVTDVSGGFKSRRAQGM